MMKSSVLYRIASVLLVLFAAGHTLGFRNVDSKWGIDSVIGSMKTIHFNASGSDRTYWDFFVGFGLFVTALMVFAALVSWQLAGLSPESLASMRVVAWGFVACFAVVVFLSWRYFFVVPLIFSAVITICLAAAAWLSGPR